MSGTHPFLQPLPQPPEVDLAADFTRRHIGPSEGEIQQMLAAVGATSLEALIAEAVPADIRQQSPLDLGAALSETEALAELRTLAAKNRVLTSLIGQGYYGTITPGVIQRNILENPAWYTAYTPYQPEISQGRLEALINFQTMICDLTGLEIANASMLDEPTAAAEAMAMARRISESSSNVFFVDNQVFPQTLAVLQTRAEPLGWQLEIGDPSQMSGEYFGALFQYPGREGAVRDFRAAIEKVKAQGGVACMAADLLGLTLLTPPGEMGADIAIGSAQRFGVPMGYGGPHAGYLATLETHTRKMPGRLVGVSVDGRGRKAYRLALQTREQHIRREKATSNICTAQVLLAVMASMYAVYHGPEGLVHIAQGVRSKAASLAAGLRAAGFKIRHAQFFDTICVEVGGRQGEIVRKALEAGINVGRSGDDAIIIAVDETTTAATLKTVAQCFGAGIEHGNSAAIPVGLSRSSAFLAHPVFHAHRSETEMLRYIRKLSDRDLALDRTMIPLGSCTMKLNATTEMVPVTWPEFAAMHPFAPRDQGEGYAALFHELQAALCRITGYDAVSLQPNSGAQGEFAGLMAIRGYHRSRGEGHRNICLIPVSAHGTNPASAHMAGMEVVAVASDAAGSIDVDDLRAKAAAHTANLAAIMITYPSTHGVFEDRVREICDIVHSHGGQVYIDGANMNAQVGLARPADYGVDVSHLNLHKTFCIPHGGGGPGMGPIGVKAHLAPFVPGHPFLDGDQSAVGAVNGAPWGSASILPISYLYIRMMAGAGLRRASEVAILNANYVAARLNPHFPVLYKNAHGRVAHECIVDPRPLQKTSGVTVDDIAKRLIDHGFHAPTMSFPVAGTLMVEPTESESKAELDRFCEAMLAIRAEIAAIERGEHKVEDSPLRHAPHTAADLAEDAWTRPYSRKQGCLPNGETGHDKYWPPVNRVDNAYGDRNLFCVCPPVEDTVTSA